MKKCVFSFCLLLTAVVVAAESDTFCITPTSKQTVYWQGIRAASVAIPVEVPSWATSAVLTVTDLTGRMLVNETFSESVEYSWTVFTGTVPENDNFYILKLEVKIGATLMQTNTATLALVRNAFEPTILTSKTVSSWGEAGDVLVLPYSDRWGSGGELSATLSGATGNPETVEGLEGDGWFARQLAKTGWKRGAVELKLTNASEDSWSATVERIAGGLVIVVR